MTASYKRIGAVQTAFQILEHLSNQSGLTTAKQLAADLQLPYGTVMSHIATLVDGGYISQVGDALKIGTRMSLFWLRLKAEAESRSARLEQALALLGTI